MRRRRPLLILLSVLALVSGMAGLMSPAANALNGWYTSPVTGYLSVQVFYEGNDGGDENEWLTKIECTSGGETWVEFGGDGSIRLSGTSVYYSIGDTGAGSDSFSCTAYYDLYHVHCVFGCWNEYVYSFTRNYGVGPFRVDLSRPTVEPVLFGGTVRNGWYSVPGTVRWRGSDPDSSGLTSCSPEYVMPAVNTSGASVQGTCTDYAGNTSFPASAFWKLDMTAPALAPTFSATLPFQPGEVVTAVAHATDQTRLSGVESESCDAVDTSTTGAHTVTCRAMDRAGNEASVEVPYQVGYGFTGFGAPVENDVRNLVKAGRTVPLKFTVTDGTSGVAGLVAADVTVKATSLSCDRGTTDDDLMETVTGASGLQDLGGGSYQLNWATPKSYAGSCKTLSVSLPDDVPHQVAFEFVK